MNTAIMTRTATVRPAAEQTTTRTPERKIFFGTTAILLAVTAAGLALGLGNGSATAPTHSDMVPSTATTSHVTPDHILQPR